MPCLEGNTHVSSNGTVFIDRMQVIATDNLGVLLQAVAVAMQATGCHGSLGSNTLGVSAQRLMSLV